MMLSRPSLAFKICCCFSLLPPSTPQPPSSNNCVLLSKMKLFGWIQNKLRGGQETKASTTSPRYSHKKVQETREEFSDWPHGWLAIGTFGSKQLCPSFSEVTSQQTLQVSSDEAEKLEEIRKLLATHGSDWNSPSMLEMEKHISMDKDYKDEEDVERTIGHLKGIWSDNKNKSMGKKSVSFLLQKMFACRGGFAGAPSLRDTPQETRMEKVLRTVLYKKMRSGAPPTKTCIEEKQSSITEEDGEEEEEKKGEKQRGCKWVRTNSDYIVLDI